MKKLKILADALGGQIADFFDTEEASPLDSLDSRWIKKIQDLQSLPESDRKEINQHINSLMEKSRLKKEQNPAPTDI